jgi:carboxylesterase type B
MLRRRSDHALSRDMAALWVQFAKTTDPNGPGLSHWPIHHSHDYQLLEDGDHRGNGPS